MLQVTFGLSGDPDQTAVERALQEFRAGRPILIDGGTGAAALALAAETLDESCLDAAAAGQARLLLTGPRLRRLGVPDRPEGGAIALVLPDRFRIEALALAAEGPPRDALPPVGPLSSVDRAALELARLALLLPAVVALPLGPGVAVAPTILRVAPGAVLAYRHAKAHALRIVGRAPVPLDGAPETEFVVFRGGEGLRDQVAVVVGRPDRTRPVAVRLHSACLTGDLFGSLKCDCGDQLRDAVRRMAGTEGGVLLYLDQEGRGTGIANKIRAYELQARGYDTYEADEALGFGLDGRRFEFAAEMLRQLDVTQVRVFTNNPEKAAALRRAGLDVVAEERVHGRPTPENVRYLAAKRDRTGHHIDLDAAAVPAVPKVRVAKSD